jgi:hypothetical protein
LKLCGIEKHEPEYANKFYDHKTEITHFLSTLSHQECPTTKYNMAKARLRMGPFFSSFQNVSRSYQFFSKIHVDPLENLGDYWEGLGDHWEGLGDRWEGLGDA